MYGGLAFLMQTIAIKLGFEITGYQDYFSLNDIFHEA